MSEETTQNLTGARSFEERIFAELTAMRADFSNRFSTLETRFGGLEGRWESVEGRLERVEGRLASLDEKVDARLRETRPIWESVQLRLTEIESILDDINHQLKTLVMDSFKLRVRVEKLEDGPRSPAP
jgi:predicted nuclease with TOPRIM domain